MTTHSSFRTIEAYMNHVITIAATSKLHLSLSLSMAPAFVFKVAVLTVKCCGKLWTVLELLPHEVWDWGAEMWDVAETTGHDHLNDDIWCLVVEGLVIIWSCYKAVLDINHWFQRQMASSDLGWGKRKKSLSYVSFSHCSIPWLTSSHLQIKRTNDKPDVSIVVKD